MRIQRMLVLTGFLVCEGFFSPNSANSAEQVEKYEIPFSAPRILEYILLKDTLLDVTNKLGISSIYRVNADTEAPKEVCYLSLRKDDHTTLILRSGFSGNWEKITGFTLYDATKENRHKCATTKFVSSNIRVLDEHLALGMTKQQVLSEIGPARINDSDNLGQKGTPKSDNPDVWIYLTTWPIPFTEKDKEAEESAFGPISEKDAHWDAITEAELRFESSKLVSIKVDYSVTY